MVAEHGNTSATFGLPMAGPALGAVRREVTIDAGAEEVWEAVTDQGSLAAWFGASAEIDVRRGGAVRFRWADGTERRGVIVTLDPPRRLAFRWRGIAGSGTHASVVVFELEPSGERTRVSVTETPGIADAGEGQLLTEVPA